MLEDVVDHGGEEERFSLPELCIYFADIGSVELSCFFNRLYAEHVKELNAI